MASKSHSMHREAWHHVVHTRVSSKMWWSAEWPLLVLLVVSHGLGEWRHHGWHVLIAVGVSLDGKSVLFVPAPFVDLSNAEPSLLRNSLALRVAPGRVHLELLLQDHLLVTVLLGPSLRLVLLALILSAFLLVFATVIPTFLTFLFLYQFIAFHFFILIGNRIFLQFIQFRSQFFIPSFIEWLLNTHVILILIVRKKIVEVRLEGHLVHAAIGDLSKWRAHWTLQMRRFWLINRLIFVLYI